MNKIVENAIAARRAKNEGVAVVENVAADKFDKEFDALSKKLDCICDNFSRLMASPIADTHSAILDYGHDLKDLEAKIKSLKDKTAKDEMLANIRISWDFVKYFLRGLQQLNDIEKETLRKMGR